MSDAAALSIPLKNLKNNRHREFCVLSAAIVKIKCNKDAETKKKSGHQLLQVSTFILIFFFLKNHKKTTIRKIFIWLLLGTLFLFSCIRYSDCTIFALNTLLLYKFTTTELPQIELSMARINILVRNMVLTELCVQY